MSRFKDAIASGDQAADTAEGRRILKKLAEKLAERGITESELGRLSRVSMWQTVTKDSGGEAQIHDLAGFQLSPSWETGPEWPVVDRPPVKAAAKRRVTKSKNGDGTVNVLVLPDMQIGYYRHPGGELEPTHDNDAIRLACELIKEVKPSKIVLLGDNLDLPEFGKYRLSPAFAQTTQAAVDDAYRIMADIRYVAGDETEIIWLAGNHEERLQNWIMDNASAAFGLRKGGVGFDGAPVLSVPYLCRLDELDIEYKTGYPASDIWITADLKIIHGDRVNSRGSTAHKYLEEQQVSVIYGHVHRIEQAHKTREHMGGDTETMAASPGCLARIDGAVPSTKQGTDFDGRPLHRTEDWQQGVAVVTVFPDDSWQYELARINKGTMSWRGKRYSVETS